MAHDYNTFFEWTELYQAIADGLLLEYENDKDALFDKIRDERGRNDTVKTRVDNFDDTRKAAGETQVTHLDPFTLMGTCNYSGKEGAREKRNKVVLFWVELLELQNSQNLSDDTKKIIKKLQNGEHPLQFRGVPTIEQNRIFANTKGHIEDDIERLWQLLASATQWADGKGNENDFMSAFDKAIEINDFALMKGTSPLFWARPNFFLSLDEPSREYIKIQMQKDDDFFEGFDAIKRGQGAGRGKRYLKIREEVKKNIHSNFLQLSYEAYEEKNAKESYPKLHQASLKSIELDYTRTDEEKKEVKRELRKIRDNKKPYTTKKAIVESRVGQGDFRNELLEYWHGSCAVTAFNNKKLLRASHIQPWSKSNDQERVDRDNGLLLSPDLDLAFDRGFITFNDDGTIEISKHFANHELLGITNDMRIDASKLTDQHKHYLKYHRNNIFKEN